MDLFVIVIALLFVQVWGADNPLHRDEWLTRWADYIQEKVTLSPTQLFIVAVFVPVLSVLLLISLIAYESYWPLLPIGVVILLYSFGRGEFSEIIGEYTKACYDEDWESAIERAKRLSVDVEGIAQDDWSTLHQHVLDEAAYRGFERMFAILFWFFLLGPIGALLYRVAFIFNEHANRENAAAKKFLWMMEWPAVRVLGLSFALTGNFVGCIHRWRESLLCVKRPTQMTIGQSVLGALSVDDDLAQTCEVTRKELSLLDKLYRRTLWFWLAMAAVLIIIS